MTSANICNMYNMIGRSIVDIYDWSALFTEARSAEVNMSAEVGYIGHGLTYRTTYDILYGECATGTPFWVRRLKNFRNNAIFALKSISLIPYTL